MLELLRLSQKSLFNRKVTTALTVFTIALSVTLLLGIERIRHGAKESFEKTVSQVDLIVGARSSPIHLLLYSVFRIGDATNNVSYSSYMQFANHEDVEWSIPISLGDSHKGYRVIGTNDNYFKHYRFSGSRKLKFSSGKKFEQLFDVVIGSDIAKALSYKVGKKIILSHGTSKANFQDHEKTPFTVVGVLEKTGTPVDRSLHVSLQAIEALHVDWTEGAPPRPGEETSAESLYKMELQPKTITAFFLRLKSKMGIFYLQREMNEFDQEALSAILPGVSLQQLWQTLNFAEKALQVVSFFVFLVSLVSILLALLTTLNERRREMSILRSIGAPTRFIFALMIFESSFLALLGILTGVLTLYVSMFIAQPLLEENLGLTIGLFSWTSIDSTYTALIFAGATLIGIFPAWQAYRRSLIDGLAVKL